MKFKYQARTEKGELRMGIIEASSKEAALNLLQKFGYFVTFLEEEKTPVYAFKIKLRKGISSKELLIFTRQLSFLVSGGVPLVLALETLASQIKDFDLRERILKMAEKVEAGVPFSEVVAENKDIFPPIYAGLIKSGEAVGKVSQALEALAEYFERAIAFRQKLIGALMYPSMVLLLFFSILFFLLFKIFPTFETLFVQKGMALPWSTKIFLSFSHFLSKIWLPLLLSLFFLILFFLWFKRTEKGEKIFEKILFNFPIIGSFLKRIYLAQIAQNLSLLISGGVPIAISLELTSKIAPSKIYKEGLKEVEKMVKKGSSLAFAFSSMPEIFPPFFTQLISAAEKTGTLSSVLIKLSHFEQNEIERWLENFLRILEPLLIILIAGLVGLLVASVIIPLYQAIGTY